MRRILCKCGSRVKFVLYLITFFVAVGLLYSFLMVKGNQVVYSDYVDLTVLPDKEIYEEYRTSDSVNNVEEELLRDFVVASIIDENNYPIKVYNEVLGLYNKIQLLQGNPKGSKTEVVNLVSERLFVYAMVEANEIEVKGSLESFIGRSYTDSGFSTYVEYKNYIGEDYIRYLYYKNSVINILKDKVNYVIIEIEDMYDMNTQM